MYDKQQWYDHDPATPASASRFNHFEAGIEKASDRAFSAPVRGLNVVFDGDSITAGNNGGALDKRGNSFPLYASVFNQAGWRYIDSLAVPGSRLDEMVSRFDATVALSEANVVHLIAGTNNVSQADSVSVFVSQLNDYLKKVRGIGARLILGTLPPRNVTPASRRALTLQYNRAIHNFGAANGVDIIDYYSALVDPATGSFKSGLGNVDQTHPTSAGNRAIAELLVNHLKTLLPTGGVYLCQDNADTGNLVSNGMFLGSITNPDNPSTLVPSGWSVQGGTHRAGITASVDNSDTTIPGAWYVLDFNNFTGTEYIVGAVSSGNVVPGARYALTGRFSAEGLRNSDSGNGATLVVAAIFNGNDTTAYRARALSGTAYDVDSGVFGIEFTAPSDAASMNVQIQLFANTASGGPGKVKFSQVSLYNTTGTL